MSSAVCEATTPSHGCVGNTPAFRFGRCVVDTVRTNRNSTRKTEQIELSFEFQQYDIMLSLARIDTAECVCAGGFYMRPHILCGTFSIRFYGDALRVHPVHTITDTWSQRQSHAFAAKEIVAKLRV